jgi:thioredoxin-related protein
MKLKESVKTDQDWKNLCKETFDFIQITLESNPEATAAKLAA